MSCLVIAELENGTPNRPSLAAISASLELESTIDLLVFNPDKIERCQDYFNDLILLIDFIMAWVNFSEKLKNDSPEILTSSL